MPRHPAIVVRALALLLLAVPSPALADTIASRGDASISHDSNGNWQLAAGGATLSIAADASRDYAILKLTSASGKSAAVSGGPDTHVRVNGQSLAFGNRAAGFSFDSVDVQSIGNTLQLAVSFTLPAASLRVTRHYAIVSGSPSFEVWNTYTPNGRTVTVADLNALQLTIPTGTLHYLTGLKGDTADTEGDHPFTLRQQTMANGQRFTVGAQGRSSEQTVPWFSVDGAADEFFAALMWSGAWSLSVDRAGSAMAFSFGLAGMSTSMAQAIDGPHAVFGVTPGGIGAATAALRSYVLDGLRDSRPFKSLVTFNTWFAYGTDLDESSMRAEMAHAAALGVDLFVIDAGWYEGAGAAGSMDFDSGLGSWTADPARFPNGLAPLREFAHTLGMRFGLWIEPERVNLSVLGPPGVEEPWLATAKGAYGSDHAGQICLASAAARQWLLDKISGLIDEVQPDYLKWDNNMWINCDREGHGHGSTDGNFAHVHGLYDMLSTLRERYPDLLIENVSGGGNRLDLGMLRYTDVAWMDDRTAPSVNVRHNIEGLSAVFPPAYLLSFVTDHDVEPLHEAPDLSLYFRSRMVGTLGLCFRTADFSEGETSSIAREIAIYKTMRDTLSVAAGALLTTQAGLDEPPAWDVLQETASGNQQVLVSAFQTDEGVHNINVKPTTLDGSTMYQVLSVDTGVLGTASGSDLMANGVDLLQSPNTAAHILIITARQ